MKFAQLLEKLPNLERLVLDKTDVVIRKSWPEVLLKHKNGNKFKELRLTIHNAVFNVGSLAKFIVVS
uniref:Uncharacterized protein n=1 Tax=Panagrolaimus davidi TaxID=227884 RepID=A0A914QYA8_9BILA